MRMGVVRIIGRAEAAPIRDNTVPRYGPLAVDPDEVDSDCDM